MTPHDIHALVKEHEIRVIRIFFTDILGRLKGLNIHVDELDRALDEGINFDGSSVEGFVRIEESDLTARPDPASFRIFPFDHGGTRSALMMCDVLRADGTPQASDPRQVLARTLDRAKAMGFDDFFVGPELEYFYFDSSKAPIPLDEVGYFDVLPLDRTADAREATSVALQSMGMRVEATHHEVAPSQHEIDFRYGEAMKMADQMMLARLVIKEVARRHGLYATFMPKPIKGENGSGMHVHQSLFKGGLNAFYDGSDAYGLSAVGRGYTAGLLDHARELTAVTNQYVNSYKRLVPGYEAPVYVSWGRRNRSTLVRVPAFKETANGRSCRVEYRAPDPAANPYLAFAVMLGAGLDGIERELTLRPPEEANIFHMSASEKAERGISSLPGSLNEATNTAEGSAFLAEVLGADLFDKFIANKRAEWDEYRTQVTDFEIQRYLPIL
ncbi:MAG: glutamine synthetase [Deltaproteobacteria bacterium]|nr:glutamine synthetase [Deltaproteobacteria bacterium]